MKNIKEAFSRMYTNIDILPRHLALLALAGVTAIFVYPMNQLSNIIGLALGQKLLLLSGLVIIFAIHFYLFGYNVEVFRASGNDEIREILPPLKLNVFKNAVKLIPSALMWAVYLVLSSILAAVIVWGLLCLFKVPSPLTVNDSVVIINPLLLKWSTILSIVLTFTVTKILYPFVMAKYAESGETKDLWRFTLPFKMLFSHFKAIIILWIKLIPLFVLLLLVTILSVNYNVFAFVADIFRAYLCLMVIYVMYYNYVQILKD